MPDALPALPVTRRDVEAAAARIRGRVRRTPVLEIDEAALGTGCDVVLKLDLFQPTGSFKPRGAFSLLLGRPIPAAGVVAASGGNFGLAVAHAARELGCRATVFVPDTSPAAKLTALRSYGADVVVVAGYYPAALASSIARAEETGALFAHAYDDPLVVAGQGTCARELEDQRPDLDTVLVSVGGGGLAGGMAAWYEGRVKMVAVETAGTPALHAARAAGRPVDVEVGGIAASSLGAGRIGDIAWELAERYIDDSVLVPDDAVRRAQHLLWEQARLVAEPGGAAALAALVDRAYVPGPSERVAVVVCGANCDPADVVRPV